MADGPGAAALQVLGKPYTRTQPADRSRAALNAAKRRGRPPDGRPHVRGPSHEG